MEYVFLFFFRRLSTLTFGEHFRGAPSPYQRRFQPNQLARELVPYDRQTAKRSHHTNTRSTTPHKTTQDNTTQRTDSVDLASP